MSRLRDHRAWPWLVLLVGLLAMAPGLVTRVDVETRNATFELTMPDDELIELIHSGVDGERVYNGLTGAGLRSVAVEMETPGKLEEDGRIAIFERSELIGLQILAGAELDELPEGDGAYVLLLDEDPTILERVAAAVPTAGIEPVTVGGREFHLISGVPVIEDVPIGYDDAFVDQLVSRGIGVIARVPSVAGDPDFVRAELERLRDEHGIDRILFTGISTPFVGSPDADAALADWLADEGFAVVLIEFTPQEGIEAYVDRIGRAVRLHALNLAVLASPAAAIDQGVRAVKERNIRILFVRPSDSPSAEGRLEELVRVMRGVTAGVPGIFSPGPATPFDPLVPTPLLTIGGVLASAGIAAAAGALLGAWWAVAAGGLMALLAIGASATGIGMAGDLLRLGVAILVSVVAVFAARPARSLPPALIEFGKAVAVVIAGGLTISGLAYGNQYLVNADDFWGVKALLIAPPAIVAAWAAYQSLDRPRWGDTITILSIPLRAWHVVALGAVGALVWYLLLRSDNTGSATDLELSFRQQLENLLYVRPRIKEFLFGFPALVAGIVLVTRTRHAWWLYVAAAVGVASAVDTFTHFHSPLLISILRTVLGAAIGLVLGVVALWLLGVAERGARWLGILPRA